MPVTITIHDPMLLMQAVYDFQRDQYRAKELLDLVRAIHGEHVIGLTEVDLYAAGLNFVFGLADCPGRAAIISRHRLHSPDVERFRERVAKETVKENGFYFMQHGADTALF